MSTATPSPTVARDVLLQGAWLALEQCGRLLRDAGGLYSLRSYSTAIAVAMFAREELGRHYVLLEKWKEAATGSLPTAAEIRKACGNHSEKQQRALLSVMHFGGDPEIGKATLAQSKNPPGSPEFEAAEQTIAAWVARERVKAPSERHQARMASLYVDVRDDGCGWNKPCEIDRGIAYQTVNHAMNDYRLRTSNLLTHEILTILDPELSTALQAWDGKPDLVHLPHFPMDGADIYC